MNKTTIVTADTTTHRISLLGALTSESWRGSLPARTRCRWPLKLDMLVE
jgi:hypothetical protein